MNFLERFLPFLVIFRFMVISEICGFQQSEVKEEGEVAAQDRHEAKHDADGNFIHLSQVGAVV